MRHYVENVKVFRGENTNQEENPKRKENKRKKD